jgi:hypothetical protein
VRIYSIGQAVSLTAPINRIGTCMYKCVYVGMDIYTYDVYIYKHIYVYVIFLFLYPGYYIYIYGQAVLLTAPINRIGTCGK